MLSHRIPDSVPAADRAEQLNKALTHRRHHEIIMKHAKARNDLTAFARAKYLYGLACASVDAWKQVCPSGDLA